MSGSQKSCLEGFGVTILGILGIFGSITLPDNPVHMEGWIGFAAQARFFPLVTSIAITILGVRLLILMKKNTDKTIFSPNIKKEELKQLSTVIAIVTVYLIAINMAGFLIPTIVYFIVILFYLNYKSYKLITIIGMSAAFFIVSYYLVPMMLKIQLP